MAQTMKNSKDFKAKVRDNWLNTKQQIKDREQKMESYVCQNPWKSVGIAAGIGAAFGAGAMLVKRR
jgi:ElaB/YqjD/DUF883 family membrane-anchored ribosome-binding protein